MTRDSFEKRIQDLIIFKSSKLLKAIKQMDRLDRKLLLVFNDEGGYHGILSIGDVQRYLLHNGDLEGEVGAGMRKTVRVCQEGDSKEFIRQTMVKYRIEFMPILTKEGELARIVFWEDLFQHRKSIYSASLNIPVVVMAGGQGTRLKPITNIIPKALVPIGDKPIIQIITEQFSQMGTTQFYFSVNYKAEMIRQYFDNIEDSGYTIQYFNEDKPLGTAGSLHLLKEKIKDTFFVSNCDILIDQDYAEVYQHHKTNKNELTLVAALKHFAIPYGTIDINSDGGLQAIREKPELTYLVNAGVYILEPHLLLEIPINEFFHITDLIEKIRARKGKIGVFPVSEGSWMDTGEWREYDKTQKRVESRKWMV